VKEASSTFLRLVKIKQQVTVLQTKLPSLDFLIFFCLILFSCVFCDTTNQNAVPSTLCLAKCKGVIPGCSKVVRVDLKVFGVTKAFSAMKSCSRFQTLLLVNQQYQQYLDAFQKECVTVCSPAKKVVRFRCCSFSCGKGNKVCKKPKRSKCQWKALGTKKGPLLSTVVQGTHRCCRRYVCDPDGSNCVGGRGLCQKLVRKFSCCSYGCQIVNGKKRCQKLSKSCVVKDSNGKNEKDTSHQSKAVGNLPSKKKFFQKSRCCSQILCDAASNGGCVKIGKMKCKHLVVNGMKLQKESSETTKYSCCTFGCRLVSGKKKCSKLSGSCSVLDTLEMDLSGPTAGDLKEDPIFHQVSRCCTKMKCQGKTCTRVKKSYCKHVRVLGITGKKQEFKKSTSSLSSSSSPPPPLSTKNVNIPNLKLTDPVVIHPSSSKTGHDVMTIGHLQ